MSEHPIEGMMGTTLDKIRQMVDVNTVMGDPVTTPDGTVIIPISKIGYGFASGGSDLPSKTHAEKNYFGGGAGAGVTVTPLAFLTISGGNVRLLQIDPYNSSADRVIGMIPEVADKINEFMNSRKEKKREEQREATMQEDPQV
ncbi:MAG: GerW family sporulation protein [Clostridiales bacterium]|nr:GerW family sporulation protein [Clostridiales bacterium]